MVPRLLSRCLGSPPKRPIGSDVWLDMGIAVPDDADGPFVHLITGERVAPVEHQGVPVLRAADVFRTCPVAVLEPAPRT